MQILRWTIKWGTNRRQTVSDARRLEELLSNLDCNIMLNVSKQDRNDDVRRAELREVAFRWHHLNNRITAKVLVQVLRHNDWHCKILGALNDVAWDTNEWEEAAHIALEDRLGNAKCNIWTYVEECPAELLHCHRFHVSSNTKWCKPWAPGLVVWSHGLKELIKLILLKASIIVHIIQVPISSKTEWNWWK